MAKERILVTSDNSPYNLGSSKTYSNYEYSLTDQIARGGVVFAGQDHVLLKIYGTDLTFSDNEVSVTCVNSGSTACGGAIFLSGEATFNGKTKFSNNKALATTGNSNCASTGQGGAIYVAKVLSYLRGNLTFNGETFFENNSASATTSVSECTGNKSYSSTGGAIYATCSDVTFAEKVTFTGNSATTVGTGNAFSVTAAGGALYLSAFSTLVFKKDAVFNGNSVSLKGEGRITTRCAGGAIYNNHSAITFCGTVDLQTDSDTWVNCGDGGGSYTLNYATITWDLTGGLEQYGNIKGFQRYSNVKHKSNQQEYFAVTQNITVKAEQAYGSYNIATGDLSDSTTDTLGKYEFTLTGTTGTQSIKVGDKFKSYGTNRYYTLAVSDNGTTEDTTDDKLVLNVTDCGVTVDDSLIGKWFKNGDTVTITGSYFSDSAVTSITVGGNAATLDTVQGTWSYTFDSHADTTGTEYDIVITSANSSYTTQYTLKVDTVAPVTTITTTYAGYYAEEDDIHWYRTGDIPYVKASATDETSQVNKIYQYFSEWQEYDGEWVELDTDTECYDTYAEWFKADDKAGNECEEVRYLYKTDGTAPKFSELTVSGSSSGGTDKYWVRQGAETVVSVQVTDGQGSGVKEVKLDNETVAGSSISYSKTYSTATEHGLTGYTIYAMDNVENDDSKQIMIGVDGTGPTLTVTRDPQTGISAQDTITVTAAAADDGGSGLDRIEYSIDGADAQVYSDPLTITENCTIEFTAYDNVGNASDVNTMTIEDFAPQVKVSTDEKWFKNGETVTITGTVKDGSHKGITGMTVAGATGTVSYEESGTQYIYNWSYTYTGADTKETNLTFSATDGNNKTGTADYKLTVDTVAPSVENTAFAGDTKFVDGNNKTWFRQGDTTAALNSVITDETSGLDTVTYNGITYDETGSKFAISTSSEVDVDAQNILASDVAGNENNTVAIGAYGVDGTEPTVTNYAFKSNGAAAYKDANNKVWFKMGDTTAVLSAEISDSKSGLEKALYNGFTYDVTKQQFAIDTTAEVDVAALAITATDNVGNVNDSNTMFAYGVDGTGPVITVTRDPAEEYDDNFQITVKAGAVDPQSGLKSFTYSIDGGEATAYTTALTIDNNCTITFTAEDFVGNISTNELVIDDFPGPYDMTVSVTADSKYWSEEKQVYTKVYDGTALKSTGYTYDGLVEDDVLIVRTKDNAITVVGSTKTNTEVTVMRENKSGVLKDITRFYDITRNEITLQITEREIAITLDSGISKVYDGTTAFASTGFAYTVNEGSLKLVDGDILVVTGATGTEKDAGNGYDISVTAYQIFTDVNENNVFDEGVDIDVTKNYKVTGTGKADITKKAVTLTSADATRSYDASALTNSTVTAVGFVEGEGAAYDVTGSQTLAGNSKNTFTYTLNEGTKAGNYDISTVDGTLTVTPTQDEVVITITDNFSKVYDASAEYVLTSGFTVTGLKGDDTISSITVTANSADAGIKTYTLSYTINHGSEDATASYGNISEVKTGVFTISKRALTVTTGSASKEYDGTALTCSENSADNLVEGQTTDVTFAASSTITHWSAEGVKNALDTVAVKDASGNDVTGNYEITKAEGTLSIDRKAVTLTSASDTKVYDGEALTNEVVTQTGFLKGDGCAYTVTGTQTYAGSSDNVFTHAFSSTIGSFDTDYDITTVCGTLTVTPKATLTITAGDASKTYDGSELVCSDYSFSEGILVEGDELTDVVVTGSITSAGTAANKVSSFKIMRGSVDVTSSYTVETIDGTLTVNQKDLYLTSASDSKMYDGEALTNDHVTVNGFIAGEGALYDVTGSQTEVGISKNTFTYSVISGTDINNYNVIKTEGDLLVYSQFNAKSDINGNGISDIVFQYTGGDYQLGYWMDGTNAWKSGNTGAMSANWSPAGAADMNLDGKADVVMTGVLDTSTAIGYYANGDGTDWTTLGSVDAVDAEVKLGNMTGDAGCNSVVIHSATTGELTVWQNGDSAKSAVLNSTLYAGWTLEGTGDFNGDGAAEAVLSYSDGTNGGFYTLDMDGNFTSLASLGAGWEISAIGDFSNDGTDDLVIFNKENNLLAKLGNGKAENFESLGQIDSSDWFVCGAGDYNQDGNDDLLVRQDSTGMLGYYADANLNKWNEVGRGVDMNWTVIA